MHLALDRASPNATPSDEVRVVLPERRVEKFGGNRQAQRCEIDHQLSRESQSLVDLEAAVEVGIVDESPPTDDGARLFEVDPHDHEQFGGMARGQPMQARCIFARRRRIVDRAWSDHRQQPVIAAKDDFLHAAPALCNELRPGIVQRQLRSQSRRKKQRAGGSNAKIGCRQAGHEEAFGQSPTGPTAVLPVPPPVYRRAPAVRGHQ